MSEDNMDEHQRLWQRILELDKQLTELSERVWWLKDAFFAHTHPEDAPEADEGQERGDG